MRNNTQKVHILNDNTKTRVDKDLLSYYFQSNNS